MNERRTKHGNNSLDGWTSRELVELINVRLEQSGSHIRFRALPDGEPTAMDNYTPGSSITDVLKRQAGADKPDSR